MFATVRDEPVTGVKTARLPRDSSIDSTLPECSGLPPPPDGSLSSSPAAGPDASDDASSLQVLGQVGIVELLEQEGRPTFIIDVGNSANFIPGELQIIFANPSLRSMNGLLDTITGKADPGSPGKSFVRHFTEFKAWATSFVKDRESLDVSLPSFLYEGITWTCTTLRKRLRLISGSSGASTYGHRTASTPAGLRNRPVLGRHGSRDTPSALSERTSHGSPAFSEVTDYFGQAAPRGDGRLSSERSAAAQATGSDLSVGLEQHRTIAGSKGTSQPGSLDGNGSTAAHDHVALSGGQSEDKVGSQREQKAMPSSGAALAPGFFDWTRMQNLPSMPRHVQFARAVDWAATSLGPIEQWPACLRGMCNLVMASPHAAAMYWGPDLVVIYNEAYIPLAGSKHPALMGQSYTEAWAEIWDSVADVFESGRVTGESTMKDDDCIFMDRSGFLEETYFSWSIIPVLGEDGSCAGFMNPVFEKTRRKIAERRMFTLREVGERIATTRELKGFWGQVLEGLEDNAYDCPFVLLYSVTDDTGSDMSSVHSNSIMSAKQCVLEGSLGVPRGHHAAPAQLDLRNATDGFGCHFREAARVEKPVLLRTEEGSLPQELLEGIERRGFDDQCRAAVVCPILPTTGEAVLGFFVMGINPRRPYDDDYELFVQLLSRQLATSMASVVLFEEEIKRGQRAAQLAAKDKIELSEQLAARTQEAVESDTRFTRMAELAPVGIFMADSQGHVTFFNDAWYEISRHPKEVDNADRWIEAVKEEDQELAAEMWRVVVEEKIPTTTEFRFKAPWHGRNGAVGDTWVLASTYPERAEDGSLKSIFGSLTNISQQKWAEDFQKRRTEEAVELKRQQENFIDITSHEMRNPLSAILQCADEISTSLEEYQSSMRDLSPTLAQLVENNIDAAHTIALCAQHQKRIVDDVLTLSKLDSALLLVTPVDVQPISVVQHALKMFGGELQKNDIDVEFRVMESYRKLDIDWVRLDPSRLLQVLINLTTNAIKFTKVQDKRTIIVSIGASLERPSEKDESSVSYFSTRSEKSDRTMGQDWGDGEEVFLSFAVQDTGMGLDDDEKKLLFLRFSQASPRTHVQYGGSGLGLFISRELTELQGGEIGVSSESGKGSTFAFYIKARRSTSTRDPGEQQQHVGPKAGVRKAPIPKRASLEGEVSNTNEGAEASHPVRGRRAFNVLIVEDNLVNQRVLQKQLRNLGCVAHVVNHGGEALDRLRRTKFWRGGENDEPLCVVLMDLEMPVMDGLTCTRKIREMQATGEISRHVPIVAVTANARLEQIDFALAAGMVSTSAAAA
ncbi:MAG: hypothetical protein M1832_001711 [Thelocarpon impressellum]|nr:MAG: hypothetical protein M1832_001711 [Thelocarpon impressellum]